MTLPADTEAYMVHRGPLRLVKRLVRVEEEEAEAETVLTPEDVGVGPDGRLEAAVLMELIAQTYAAAQGYRDQSSGRPPRMGYLVGASDFHVECLPLAGQPLRITIKSSPSFEDFHRVEGQVRSFEGQVLAVGTLKAWVPPAIRESTDVHGQGR